MNDNARCHGTEGDRPEPMSEADIEQAAESDPDNPPLSEADFRRMRPAAEIHPQLVDAFRRGALKRGRGAQKAPIKEHINIRLDADIVAHFRRGGAGWQKRLNDTLRRAIEKRV